MRTTLTGVCALLILSGCAGGNDTDPAAGTAAPGGTGTPEPPTSEPGTSERGTSEPGTSEPGTSGSEDAGGTATCEHPAGFRVSHPADWTVNPGEVLPECSWFAAESFDVPTATDARIADITLRVVEGSRPPSRWGDVEDIRAVEVGGLTGLRLERVAGPGLYPTGTPILTYVVDLPSTSEAGRTLVASTVGLARFDHERGVEVLDAMMASLVLDSTDGA